MSTFQLQTQTTPTECFGFTFMLDEDVNDFSEEPNRIKHSYLSSIREHFLFPAVTRQNDPALKFESLKNEWEEETVFLSSINEICMHPAYQQIIGMGKLALPFIIRELTYRPNHWFWALKSITGTDPVPSSKKGKLTEMAQIWLHWWALNKNVLFSCSFQ